MISRDYAWQHGSLHLVRPRLGRRSDPGPYRGQWALGQRPVGVEGVNLQSRDDMAQLSHRCCTPGVPGR